MTNEMPESTEAIEVVDQPGDGAETRPAAQVALRVRGRDYPLRWSSTCKVCNSPYRTEIERSLLQARTPAAIVRELPEGHGLSRYNIRDHRNTHSMAEAVVINALTAEEFEGDIDEAEGAIWTALSLLRNVVRIGGEGIQAGDIKVNIKEAVNAASILAQIDLARSEQKDDVAAMSEVIYRILEHCQQNLPKEHYEALSRAVGTDPHIARIRAEMTARRQGELAPG